jgi:hypothetical protein
MFRDTVKGRWLRSDGVYERRAAPAGEPPFRAQEHLQEEARRTAALARGRAGVVFIPEHAPRPSSPGAKS